MRYFILTTGKLPRIDRQEIDKGTMKPEAITIVNCVRSALFVSNGIRKDVNVILYPLDPGDILIRIEGDKLRYMGPDERSISVLLSIPSKNPLCGNAERSKVTSPGITVVKETPGEIIRCIESPIVLCQRPDGQDVRKIKFRNTMVYVGLLDPRIGLEENAGLHPMGVKTHVGVTGTQCDKTVLLLNNEIDRKLAKNV